MEQKLDIRRTVLTQLKIPEDAMSFLETVEVPIIREWAYLCIADGMPIDRLKKVCSLAEVNTAKAGTVFQGERILFLRENYENNKKLEEEVIGLHSKVEKMYQRASAVEGSLDETIRKALQDKDELYSKVVEGKNELIREKDRQITDLKEMIRLQEENLKKRIAPTEKTSADSEDRKEKSFGQSDEGLANNLDGTSLPAAGPLPWSGSADQGKQQLFLPYPYRQQRGLLSILSFRKKTRTIEKFIQQYFESDGYSDEQKEYLLRCLEEGLPLEMIEEFAGPNMSVEHMERLRRFIEGRRTSWEHKKNRSF